jgi:hypothetical protein
VEQRFPLRPFDQLTERIPIARLHIGRADVFAVTRLPHAVVRHVNAYRWLLAGRKQARHRRSDESERGIGHRDIDELAFAGRFARAQGEQNPDDRV